MPGQTPPCEPELERVPRLVEAVHRIPVPMCVASNGGRVRVHFTLDPTVPRPVDSSVPATSYVASRTRICSFGLHKKWLRFPIATRRWKTLLAEVGQRVCGYSATPQDPAC